MTEKLIREEKTRYYRREDGGIIMKIEEKSFVEMKDGEEVWHVTSTTIPLI
jgi:predicted GNAT family acetyltransferase